MVDFLIALSKNNVNFMQTDETGIVEANYNIGKFTN